MKEVYMVHIQLPEIFTSQFYDQIPRQKELINELLEKRIALGYSLDMDRRNLWVFFEASNRFELNSVLELFPNVNDVKVKVHELAFYDTAPVRLNDPIMN